jgi:hypothetical protein
MPKRADVIAALMEGDDTPIASVLVHEMTTQQKHALDTLSDAMARLERVVHEYRDVALRSMEMNLALKSPQAARLDATVNRARPAVPVPGVLKSAPTATTPGFPPTDAGGAVPGTFPPSAEVERREPVSRARILADLSEFHQAAEFAGYAPRLKTEG